MKHDFDYLQGLYKEDPAEFDKVTSEMIDGFINNLPESKKEIFRAKQWRLQQQLGKIKNPLARMNKMVSIFWDGANEFVTVTKNVLAGNLTKGTGGCKVIDFKKKSDN